MRQLLVMGNGARKNFKITIPDDAKVTFGPWSPPTKSVGYDAHEKIGTLRIYQGSKENILACFAGVTGFRDLSMNYMEEVAKEEGATMWKSDRDGYVREEKVQRTSDWVDPVPGLELTAPKRRRAKRG